MVKVLKKSGKMVAFKASKIQRAVMAAARDAKVYQKERKGLARMVSSAVSKAVRGRKVVKTAVIKTLALKKLGRSSRDAVAAWRKFERRKR